MLRCLVLIVAGLCFGFFSIQTSLSSLNIGISSSLAVSAPSVQERQKAEKGRLKDDKRKAKEQRESGCRYGRDRKTEKCYEPNEGQFYRDPKTGEVKVKRIERFNLPWNQDKNKKEEKKPENEVKKKRG